MCAWNIEDNISRLRLDVKGKLDDAVCAYEDWLEEMLNRVNKAIKVSTGVHDALAEFRAHDISLAKTSEAGRPSGILEFIYVRGDLSRFFVSNLVEVAFVAVLHRSFHNFSLTDGTFPAPHIFGIERDAFENKVLVGV